MLACLGLVTAPALNLVKHVATFPTPLDAVRLLGPLCGPFFMLVAAIGIVAMLYQRVPTSKQFRLVCLAGMLGIQTLFFVSPGLPLWAGNTSSHRQNLAKLRAIVRQGRQHDDRLPTVYWPQGRLDDLWIHLGVKSYFTKHQTAGSMFHRETAIEGHRRAQLVAPFELAELQRRKSSRLDPHDWRLQSLLAVLGHPSTIRPPTIDDLRQLSQEDIDFAILPHKFEQLDSHQVGPLYVYDCRRLRESTHTGFVSRTSEPPKPEFTPSAGTFKSTAQPDIR